MSDNSMQVTKSAVIFVALLLVALGFATGMFYAKANGLSGSTVITQPTPTGAAQAQQRPAAVNITMDQIRGLFGNGNLTFGDKNSKLVFVEFSDPSCPYCSAAAGLNSSLNKQMGAQFILKADGGTYVAPVPEMKKLVDAGKAAMVWVYAKGHGNGELGTQSLYCANEQGKFWQVHDLLMGTDGYALQNSTIKTDLTQTGLMANFLKSAMDPTFMKNCLDSKKYAGRLTSDQALATQFGFQGTPDFFINTTNIEGAESFTAMQSAVDAALK